MARFFGGRKNQAENDFRRFEQEIYLNSSPRPTHNPERTRPEEDAQGYVDPRFDNRSYAPPLRQENLRQDPYSQQQPPLRQQPSFRATPPMEAQTPTPSFGPLRPSRQNHYDDQEEYGQNRYRKPVRSDELKGLRFWQDDQEEAMDDSEEWVERPSPFKFIVALVGLTVMVSILWFGYRWLSQPSLDGPILIEAEPGPFKVKPENPGGSEIPYQDKLIYGRISPGTEAPVERLLPPPEQPMAPPQPLAEQPQPQGENNPQYDPQYAAQQAYPQQQQGYQASGPSAPPPIQPYPQPNPYPHQVGQGQAAPYPAQPPQGAQPYPPIQTAQQPAYSLQPQMQQPQPQAAAPVVTQAPAPIEVAPKEPVPAPKTKPEAGFYIQLGTLPTETAAKDELKRLRKKHRAELADDEGGMKDRTEAFNTTDGKKVYRALIGPFQKRNTALSKCNKLGSSCRVIQVP